MLSLRLISTALLVLALLSSCSSPASAGTNGVLEGKVREKKTHEPVPGANVFILEIRIGTTTDTAGRFVLRNIPSGRYTVNVTHIGHAAYTIRGVVVNPDLRTTIDAEMDPSDVQLQEIVVQQERPLVEHDATGTMYVVSGEDLSPLPLQDITSVIGLKAGVTLEGNVRGGRSNEVAYMVDGLPVQDVMGGGVGTPLPLSSVFGMSLYTGGFDPEYGNALSGVVNIVTRTGGDDHRVFVRVDNDDLFPITQTSKTTDAEVSLSGPVAAGSVYYTLAARGILTDTRWWQDMQYFFTAPYDRSYNVFGKVDYLITPTLRVGAQVLVNHHDWRDYEFPWRYDLGGLPPERKTSNRIAAILSHTVSENFFYTASLSRYLISSAIGDGDRPGASFGTPWQYDFFLRYIVAGDRSWWARMTQESYTAKADGTLNVEKNHVMKFGGELTLYRLNADVVRYEPEISFFGKPIASAPLLDYSSTYRFFPRTGALYVQDKIDVLDQGGLVNIGLRYDFLDVRATRPPVALSPADSATGSTTGPVSGGWKQSFSPRFGVMFPLDDKSFLTISVGLYTQYPLFDYLYSGLDRVALATGASALTGNPALDPEQSQMWEISYKRILPLDLLVTATYFKKSTTNMIDSKTFVAGDSKVSGSYGFAQFVNDPYGESSGIELTLSRSRGEWLTGEISYTYMNAEGTSGSEYQGFNFSQYGLPLPPSTFPLSWDQRHALAATINLKTPERFGAHLVVHAHTGRPYTYYPTATGFQPVANAGVFAVNNQRMPGYASADLVLEYGFDVDWWQGATLTAYCDIRNIADAQNVAWMDSNGRIGGEISDPSGYFIGRRTRLGIRITM